jgi:mono/diheme cytochrome c family protein
MLKRIFLWATCALVLAIASGVGWLFLRKPAAAPPKDIAVLATAEKVERGRYLFEHLSDCSGCHSERDFSKFGGPVKPGGEGKGSIFPDEMGLPGRVVAPNLTADRETGLGAWTDGEILRAIREGVDKDGKALFPFMPYMHYRNMSDEDVESLVAYIRTLAPVRNPLPRTELALPVALMIKSVPKPVEGRVVAPSRADSVAYGKYLVSIGACMDCHTRQEKGHPVEGMEFAGGFEFRMPQGTVVSANITPDLETGIGSWTEDGFVSRFRQYREYAVNGAPPSSPESFTLMPWLGYSQLEEEDLRAIYRYLRTIRPVTNKVNTHPAALVSRR